MALICKLLPLLDYPQCRAGNWWTCWNNLLNLCTTSRSNLGRTRFLCRWHCSWSRVSLCFVQFPQSRAPSTRGCRRLLGGPIWCLAALSLGAAFSCVWCSSRGRVEQVSSPLLEILGPVVNQHRRRSLGKNKSRRDALAPRGILQRVTYHVSESLSIGHRAPSPMEAASLSSK